MPLIRRRRKYQLLKHRSHVWWGQKRTNVLHLNEIFSFLSAGATLDPAIISNAGNLQTNLSSRAEERTDGIKLCRGAPAAKIIAQHGIGNCL